MMKWKMEEWTKMGKLGNQEINNYERLFEEKRKHLKYKKRNEIYNIHERDYNIKSDPNP